MFKGSVAYVRGEDTYHHANLPQIAPLTGQAEIALDAFTRGTLRLTCTAAHTQGNPAAGETRTPGYADFGWNFVSTALPVGGTTCRLRGGIANVFDRAYRLHLSTLRGLINEEPGRNYFLSATFAL
jgi:outer membrane receptor for ferrienterochelin and colicin